MTIRLFSGTLWGIEARPVEVEVDVARGLPVFSLVGMPATVVREARERVRAAIRNAGFRFPLGRVTINLAPADLPKPHPVFDLAIALGILAASEQLPLGPWQRWLLLGELSLDGTLRPVRGLLPLATLADGISVPGVALGCGREPPWEVRWLGGTRLVTLPDLGAAARWARGEPLAAGAARKRAAGGLAAGQTGSPASPRAGLRGTSPDPDLSDILGQQQAKRALEIAAAGGHGILLIGPPGTGKSMLARALRGLLPPLDARERVEVAQIHSAAGREPPLDGQRPFCQPHHTVPRAALVGGGTVPEPGEVSLAHAGVLFLDELPLFRREAIDALREPLEDGFVTVSRLGRRARFPCRLMLVATCNPCRCGFFGDPEHPCRCSEYERQRYWATLPGPVLDRIDLFVPVPRLPFDALSARGQGETSAAVLARVLQARRLQRHRFRGEGIHLNAEMRRWHLERHCRLDPGARELLRAAYERYGLSVRAHDRLLRVARTIADLAGCATVEADHVAEALAFRRPVLEAGAP